MLKRFQNDVIDADLTVTEEYISLEEARRDYNISRLPSDTDDNIRIVKVGDYDACPCIGPHVSSTKMNPTKQKPCVQNVVMRLKRMCIAS